MSRQLIYTRKVKDIYITSEDENLIISIYKDQATMLNGACKETTKGKGVLNNQISSLIFTKLNEVGMATHFVKQLLEIEQLDKKVDTAPSEVVLRDVTTGSLSKRFGVEERIKLNTSVAEFCYKNDDLDDPFISDEYVKLLGIVSDEDTAYIKTETHCINDLSKDWFGQIGLSLIDLKLEFGKGEDDKIILADEFSPDNCRLWDAGGRRMDKDVFRCGLDSLTDVCEVALEKLRGFD